MGEAIRIDGLAQFQRNLKKLDSDLPKALRVALNEAAELVATGAKRHVPSRTGKAVASIRVASTQTAVRVREGGSRAPYMPWLDFGGRVGRRKQTKRPFIGDGRYIYPTYFEERDSGRIQQVLTDALLGVARQAGVEVD